LPAVLVLDLVELFEDDDDSLLVFMECRKKVLDVAFELLQRGD